MKPLTIEELDIVENLIKSQEGYNLHARTALTIISMAKRAQGLVQALRSSVIDQELLVYSLMMSQSGRHINALVEMNWQDGMQRVSINRKALDEALAAWNDQTK